MAVPADYFRSSSELGLSPVYVPGATAGARLVAERDVPAQPVPPAPCSAQRYSTSKPRLTTKPRALSARAQMSPAHKNIHVVDNVSSG